MTHQFADLGADVIKIEEPPLGDYIREVKPTIDGVGIQHLTLDRNKRSISLSLRTPEGQRVLHVLAANADAVVESSRPGTMRRRSADFETLSALNPRLVYLSYTGYGQTTRYAHLPSHGSNLASFAGVNPIARRDDDVIVHGATRYGRYRASMELAGLQAAFVLLAAVSGASKTGQGRYLDMSVVHTLITGDYAAMTNYANTGELFWQDLPQPTPKYGYYECADGGTLLVCALEKSFWEAFCSAIERPDLATRGDWDDQTLDFGVTDVALYRDVQRTIVTRSLAAWLEVLIPAGVPCSPVNSIAELIEDPDLGGRLFTDAVTLESGREVSLMAPPLLDENERFASRPAPSMGRDTEAVLRDFAVASEIVDAARAAGALPPGIG